MSARPPRRGPLLVRIELGLAAFAPAFALIGLRSWGQWWSWAFFALAAVGILVLVVGALYVARGNPDPIALDEIQDASDQVVGYIAAYIVPVVIDTSTSTLNAVIATVALFVVFLIHVATGRVHINPLLYLLGYRVYTAKTKEGTSFFLVARTDVADWTDEHPLVDLASSVLVERWSARR
ncbi:YpmS family protein [Microbacterium ulmi]|uniref:Uncharacterized protein n=1 Tax=Microbacterium ulmi TaxID=179095 RepID=A0A7Y2LYX5_9MICO|nr:YpmS family protein [Microbacterium ulmi]NII68343.1 hypothetical protein [Microbacterium ulmi]NNH03122.1 hypothetical protein [Microbacterium ulmi]